MFCAICTSETGPFFTRPLGRDGALVRVCRDCDGEPVVARRGPDADRPAQAGVSQLAMKGAIGRFAASVDAKTLPRNETAREARPGYLIIRINRRDKFGKPRDRREAVRVFEGEPWARDVTYLGTDFRFHIFERPDPALAKKSRQSDEQPLAALEPYRVKEST